MPPLPVRIYILYVLSATMRAYFVSTHINIHIFPIEDVPTSNAEDSPNKSSDRANKATIETLNAELCEEKKKNAELDKELKLQVSLKAESDMAMKLLEKDIHEKQDTIVSLRRQLDDIKQINLEMYRKLQVGTRWWRKSQRLQRNAKLLRSKSYKTFYLSSSI